MMLLIAVLVSMVDAAGDLTGDRLIIPTDGLWRGRCRCDPDVTTEYYECDTDQPWIFTEDKSPAVFGAIIASNKDPSVQIKGVKGSVNEACKRCAIFAAVTSKGIFKHLGLKVTSSYTVCFYCTNNVMGEAFLRRAEKWVNPTNSYGHKCVHMTTSELLA